MDGGSILALGFGPAATLRGDLADHFGSGTGGGRWRLGGRFGRFGVELVMSWNSLASDRPGTPSTVLVVPTLAYYAVRTPPLQLAARGGIAYGAIEGLERHEQVRCENGEGCIVRDQVTDLSFPGFGLDLGVTAQLHLGRGHGQRPVLWVDAGLQLLRFRLDDAIVSGRSFQLTMGIAHAMEF